MSTPPRSAKGRLLPALAFLLLAAAAAAWSLWPRRATVGGLGTAGVDPGQEEPAKASVGVDLLSWFGSYDGRSPVPGVFVYAPPRPLAASAPAGEGSASQRSQREATGADATPGSRPAGGRDAAAGASPVVGNPGPRPAPGDSTSPAGPDVLRPAIASQPVARPQHQVSLVLITNSTARAVVDGKVVGVGDNLRAGRVARIVADGVQVDSGTERLFFRLGDPAGDGTVRAPAAPPGGDK